MADNPDPADSIPHEIRSILLLDDDQDFADTLKGLLEARNFLVTTVGDGLEGLKEIMSFEFDIVICDLLMPNMPGDMFYLAVERVKPQLANRFIFITGHTGNPAVDKFLENSEGIALTKPILIEDLIKAISLTLARRVPSGEGMASVRFM